MMGLVALVVLSVTNSSAQLAVPRDRPPDLGGIGLVRGHTAADPTSRMSLCLSAVEVLVVVSHTIHTPDRVSQPFPAF